MNEYGATDWYRLAQEQLTGVALAVQRQDELDLEALSAMATGIAEALKRSDQLLVQFQIRASPIGFEFPFHLKQGFKHLGSLRSALGLGEMRGKLLIFFFFSSEISF